MTVMILFSDGGGCTMGVCNWQNAIHTIGYFPLAFVMLQFTILHLNDYFGS